MARGRRRGEPNPNRYVNVPLDPELAMQVEQTMFSFGLESKPQTLLMMIRAWYSTDPERTIMREAARQAMAQMREVELSSLTKYFDDRLKLFQQSTPP